MSENRTAWLDKPASSVLRLNWETALYLAIFVAAVLTRFWDLGARAISHDESLHAYYGWELYQGSGFNHSPLYHGPLRFHLTALSFALFGVDDFTARIPAALVGVALVMAPILLRPWLGRRGALLTCLLLLISPSILYHARYIRDEAFMLLYGALMLWAVMSYLRNRAPKWLLAIAVITALMYTTMETAFIYIMIFGGFALVLAVVELARASGWGRAGVGGALLGLGAALALTAAAILIGARLLEAARPPLPDAGNPLTFGQTLPSLALIALFGVLIGGGVYFVARAILPDSARRSAGLDLAIILGGLSLFMLSAAALLGLNLQFGVESQAVAGVMETVGGSGNTVWGLISGVPGAMYVDAEFFMSGSFPTDPANVVYLLRLLFLVTAFAALGVGLGVWWNPRIWLIAMGSFAGIAVTLFTTIFTKGVGLGTGFVGSLGYWLAQHKVQRGTQPMGYYFFITPFYEYLPMLLAMVALVYFGWRFVSGRSLARRGGESIGGAQLFVPLLMLYVVAAWAIFSFAGEKMPWLMTHLALPMIVLGGRLAGDWLDRIDWRGWWDRHEWLAVLLVPLAVIGVATALGALGDMAAAAQQGAAAPSLDQLNATGQLLSGVLIGVIALVALFSLVRRGGLRPVLNTAGMAALIALALMTVRTAWQFSFVNYDYPTEFGVYAHGGPGLKIALEQIRQLSERTTGTPDQIELLYDNKATWPWLWYLRDFSNKRYIAGTPSRSDASLPVMILSDVNWPAIDQSVGSNYNWFQFARIWWPMEDYKRIPAVFECPDQVIRRDNSVVHYKAYDENGDGETDLTEQRNGDARCAGRARQMNSALWDIFFRRDYSLYGDLTGQKMTLQDWPLHEDFRLYVRKDLAAKVWDQTVGALGPGAAPPPLLSDPYQARWNDVTAIRTFGSAGAGDGQLMLPHGMAVAADGSIFVADSGNHRIVKFDANGEFQIAFGTWSGEPPNNDPLNPSWDPPSGTFTEPWDVAVGPDGSVYVADLWNNRIQKFDSKGKFLAKWGRFGQSDGQASGAEGLFYGPRGIAVAGDGTVYVADTGNKRVQIFDADGEFIGQFGGGGLLAGNLDEPVGIAVNQDGEVIVVDTWNGRLQVFDSKRAALRRWDIAGWFDPSAEEQGKARVGKPYVGAGPDGRIYLADQASSRILVFSQAGEYVSSFGQFGADERGFSAPSGVEVDAQGNVLVVDTGNARVMVFPPVDEQ